MNCGGRERVLGRERCIRECSVISRKSRGNGKSRDNGKDAAAWVPSKTVGECVYLLVGRGAGMVYYHEVQSGGFRGAMGAGVDLQSWAGLGIVSDLGA